MAEHGEKGKGLAGLLIGISRPRDGDGHDGDDGHEEHELHAIIDEVFDAIEARDRAGFHEAMKAYFDCLLDEDEAEDADGAEGEEAEHERY